jgi:hypothetical protein
MNKARLAIAGLFSIYSRCSGESMAPLPVSSVSGESRASSASQMPARRYECDGREYGSLMTSCDEATWFLQHCPNMKMDGDGIPCETQWRGHSCPLI